MPDRREEMYGEHLGREALIRQQQAARDYFACCGEWKGGPHHEACKKFVPEPPVPIEGQETLL